MIKDVRLPEISENVESGDVVKMLVSVGQTIDIDQPVVELETDKAVLEVPSPYKGTVAEVLVGEGDTILIHAVIIKVDTATTADNEPVAPDTPAVTQTAPVGAGAGTNAPESSDAAMETPVSKSSSAAMETPVPESLGTPNPPAAPAPVTTAAPAQTATALTDPAPASPSLRRLARELGVDIHQVHGTGPGGRILKDDLTSYARSVVAGARATVPASKPSDASESTKWGPILREPMSKIQQVTARTLGQAWSNIPHVTQYDKVDITKMEEIRKQYSKRLEAHGAKLTMTAILLKVVASALKVFPQFNASIDMDKQEFIFRNYYHVGVAVDTERGLLVPVIRAVDTKNITELAIELSTIAEKARNKKLTLEEMEGGTFTISNLGGIGGTYFSPIVYAPQVAILGVSRARIEPVYANDRFEPRLMLPLSVSYDHRIINGADGARFLRWIVQALEEPLLLALEG